jgi:hypothetical protein
MNFMEKKVEVWVVALTGLLGLIFTIIWANIAVHVEKGGKKAGVVGQVVHLLSSVPDVYQRATNTNRYLQVGEEPGFKGASGFSYSYAAGAQPEAGYLLLSRFDGTDRRSYVEFVDLNAQKVLHRWAPDIDDINRRSVNFKSHEIDLARDKNQSRMLIRHPFVTDDGSLLINSRTPLTKIDACSRVVWINDSTLFHHSTERTADGLYWVPTVQSPPTIEDVQADAFLDDSITAVDDSGKIRYLKSVAQMLIENGLPHLVHGGFGYSNNPIHLNDIQPVEADGPYWKKGDLFLSLRTPSTLMLYRPSTNKVIWRKDGPWSLQHDVDVLDDHRISVFNNNGANRPNFSGTLGVSEVLIYDFATQEVTSPWHEAMVKLDVRSATEGLATVLPEGELFFEEQNNGRIMRITPEGQPVWQYVNRAADGMVYRTGWSRIFSPEQGAPIAKALAAAHCGTPAAAAAKH